MINWNRIEDNLVDALPNMGMTVVVLVVAAIAWIIFLRIGHRSVVRITSRTHDEGETAAAERAQRINTLWGVMRSVALVALISIVLLTIMAIWGIPIGPLVAVGGVIGIALGFGAQDVVRDFIAGFLIVAEDQFAIGDVITVAGVTGEVHQIQLRITVLRDAEGNVHYVPNGQIKVASNYTQDFSSLMVDIGVAYREDVDRVIDVLRDELARMSADPDWSAVLLDEQSVLGVNSLGDSSVEIRVRLTTTPGEQWRARRELLRRIKKRFDEEAIEIPFPHVTVLRGSADVNGSDLLDPGGAQEAHLAPE